ncbi:MAG: DUF6596 domain-containing protein [Myxococcota bacterium]
MRPAAATIERLIRDHAPGVLGAVIRRYGDFAASEDAVQEAVLAAALRWPDEGVPADPRGWLIHVAGRRRIDQLRSDGSRRRREQYVVSLVPAELQAVPPPDELGADADDDPLVLLLMCAHPSLSTPSAVALTLRAVGGLTTGEIARAFLVPESTMAQRISRAKQTIRSSGVPFGPPSEADREARLATVLHVLYLVFNEGYASSSGAAVHRTDLASEAIRLTRAARARLPDHVDVDGLLALMLLTDARAAARTGPGGELIALEDQDRRLWDRTAIDEGVALVHAAMARGGRGPYLIQAAIAALHDEAPSVDGTDWPQILALYGVLESLADNPMVTLSRAVATAMVHGPEAGLAVVATLDGRLAGSHRLDAVRGHLLERAGDRDGAIACYRAAAGRTTNTAERDWLVSRVGALLSGSTSR